MPDGSTFPTWREEMAADDRARRDAFIGYLRDNLAKTQAKRRLVLPRDLHRSLAASEAHYRDLLERTA